jgi:hypothetical protein
MSILSNIIDALRRIGSPTEKSALRRQDSQLEGRAVVERGRIVARQDGESVQGFRATVEPYHEEVSVLADEDIESIHQNALLAPSLFEAFDIETNADLLDQLDKAFKEWICSSDQRGYSRDDIMEILGACFGEHCNATLGMRWVKVSDQYGTSLAVDGVDVEFRAFPYHSIAKRIAGSEHTFFRGIYVLLKDQKQHSRVRQHAT